jgi:hypothetical protein
MSYWTLGEPIGKNTIGIDAPNHGHFLEAVWRMDGDESTPECEQRVHELIRVMNLWEQHKISAVKLPPINAEYIYSVVHASQAVKLCRTEYINMAEMEVIHPEVGKLLHDYAKRAIEMYVVGQPPQQAVPIEWGEVQEPNENIRYHHVIGVCALGKFTIEWKNHKEHDSRCVYLNGEWIASPPTLETAKNAAQDHVNKIFNALMGKEI